MIPGDCSGGCSNCTEMGEDRHNESHELEYVVCGWICAKETVSFHRELSWLAIRRGTIVGNP